MNESELYLKKEYVFAFATILPFVFPDGFAYFMGINTVITYYRAVVFGILLFDVVADFVFNKMTIDFNRTIMEKINICIISLCIVVIISTYINQTSMSRAVQLVIVFAGCMLWCNRFLKYNFAAMIKLLAYYFFLVTLINNICLILFPNGIMTITNTFTYVMHFWGIDNTFAPLLIPGMCITILYFRKYTNCSNLFFCFVEGNFLFSALYTSTMTASICLILVVMLYFVTGNMYMKRLMNPVLLLAIVAFLFVNLNINGQIIGSAFIEQTLNKTSTYSGRTIIWAQVIALVANSPLIGYGMPESDAIVQFNQWSGLYNAHSLYLQYLYIGGALLMVPFISVIVCTATKFKVLWYDAYGRILVLGVLGLLIYFLFEYSGCFTLLILIYMAVIESERCELLHDCDTDVDINLKLMMEEDLREKA